MERNVIGELSMHRAAGTKLNLNLNLPHSR